MLKDQSYAAGQRPRSVYDRQTGRNPHSLPALSCHRYSEAEAARLITVARGARRQVPLLYAQDYHVARGQTTHTGGCVRRAGRGVLD